MAKLIKVIALKNGHMDSGLQFCEKGQSYPVVKYVNDDNFDICDMTNRNHTMDVEWAKEYFELIYECDFEDVSSISGLRKQEEIIMEHVANAHGEFLKLQSTHPCENTDWTNAIHTLQSILAMRVMRRNYPKYWLTHKD